MIKVKALRGFEHYGSRKKNSEFEVYDDVARELAQKGLVVEVKPSTTGNPKKTSRKYDKQSGSRRED